MAANLTTTYDSQILDLLGLSKFKGGIYLKRLRITGLDEMSGCLIVVPQSCCCQFFIRKCFFAQWY